MKFEVVMYDKRLEAVARAFVEADDSASAHTLAMALLSKQYPQLDTEALDHTVVLERLYRGAMT